MKGFVVWITGLPGSGKRALARALAQQLQQRGRQVEVIDSGALRDTPLASSLGFSRQERVQNCLRHAFAAKLLANNGVVAIVSAVSPYRETRDTIRSQVGAFAEVAVTTPKETCIDRDTRGVWAAALRGEIRNFTGVDDPYEAPLSPEFAVDLSHLDEHSAARALTAELSRLELLTGATAPGLDNDPLARELEDAGFKS